MICLWYASIFSFFAGRQIASQGFIQRLPYFFPRELVPRDLLDYLSNPFDLLGAHSASLWLYFPDGSVLAQLKLTLEFVGDLGDGF